MENNEYSDYRKETEPIRPAQPVNEPKRERSRMNIWSCCSVVCIAIVLMFTLSTCGFVFMVGK